jgi:nicotinate-nucleotide adenylyltransferase
VRLGLFGGTFNPVHLGHLRAAVEVAEAFTLDKLLLIPSANPPHKTTENMADASKRLEMLRLAIEGVPAFEASDVELARKGPSYTIETLRYFQGHFGRERTIHFVVGQDAFSEITTWKSFRELFVTSHFIVMARPGSKLESLDRFIRAYISKDYQYDSRLHLYAHPEWCSIFRLDVTHLDISATMIREAVRRRRSIRFLVPPQVEEFIKRKGLYQ